MGMRAVCAMVAFTGTSSALAVVEPLPLACPDALKVNFFGDFFVTQDRLRKNAFEPIQPLLDWAHFNVVNFEGTVTTSQERAFPEMPFALKMSPDAAKLLDVAGIRHVTRGNNHSMDFGLRGMLDTSAALAAAGVHFVGVGKNVDEALVPLILKHDKTRLALHSFAAVYPDGAWASSTRPGVVYPVPERMQMALAASRERNDFVATSFHWGGERTLEIRDYQKTLAKIAADKGVDLVFGHHAHMAQGIESVQGVPVLWGLGNFLFTSYGSGDTLSLGLITQFCGATSGRKASMTWAVVPFHTGSEAAMLALRPLDLAAFQRLATRGWRDRALSLSI